MFARLVAHLRACRSLCYDRGYVAYLCLAAWVLYYIAVPMVFAHSTLAGLAVAVFPGAYIGIWAIYLMHECWHRYFAGIDNRTLFVMFCCVLFTQPNAYSHGHRSHHKLVNTYADLEIHPIGRIERRIPRALYNSLSFVFGSLFLLFFGLGQAGSDAQDESAFNDKFIPLAWVGAWASIATLSHWVTGAAWSEIAISYLLSIWVTSFVHRHNEMIEHGGVIADGDLGFRVSKTRNLAPRGILSNLFLFLVHQDSREHTLHHSQPSENWRPRWLPSTRLPSNAVYITLSEYARLVLRMMWGHESPELVQRSTGALKVEGSCKR